MVIVVLLLTNDLCAWTKLPLVDSVDQSFAAIKAVILYRDQSWAIVRLGEGTPLL